MFLATVITVASFTASLPQVELMKFVSGDGTSGGCGVIKWFAEFEAQRVDGSTVKLFLACPELAPIVPEVGDICRVSYNLSSDEQVPESDGMVIEALDCGPHLELLWQTLTDTQR